jgi:hypothetical protein
MARRRCVATASLLSLAAAAAAAVSNAAVASVASGATATYELGASLASAADIAAVVELTSVTNTSYCVDFSPYVENYAPGVLEPPASLVGQLLDVLIATGKVKCIQVYGTLGGPGLVAGLAAARGLPVLQIIYLTNITSDNQVRFSRPMTTCHACCRAAYGMR